MTKAIVLEKGLVLMPCRALEAFRLTLPLRRRGRVTLRLNALSGIGGAQTKVLGGSAIRRQPES